MSCPIHHPCLAPETAHTKDVIWREILFSSARSGDTAPDLLCPKYVRGVHAPYFLFSGDTAPKSRCPEVCQKDPCMACTCLKRRSPRLTVCRIESERCMHDYSLSSVFGGIRVEERGTARAHARRSPVTFSAAQP